MTVRFSIRHNYKGIDLSIEVEASDCYILSQLVNEALRWFSQQHDLVDRIVKVMRGEYSHGKEGTG